MKTLNKDTVQKMIIAALLGLLSALLCGLFGIVFNPRSLADPPIYGPVNVLDFPRSGSYKIDVGTILKFIDSGHPPIFLHETEVIPVSYADGKWTWTQAEHFKVANALFEFVWKETISKQWSISQMAFDKYCEENPAGFESSSFLFDELIFQGGEFNYKSRAIEISLSDEVVSWGGNSGYPRPFFGTNQFYLEDLKITADDALRIAEENGGRAARQSVQNKCSISISMDENWRVMYHGPVINHSTTLFEITIDPYIGEIITSH